MYENQFDQWPVDLNLTRQVSATWSPALHSPLPMIHGNHQGQAHLGTNLIDNSGPFWQQSGAAPWVSSAVLGRDDNQLFGNGVSHCNFLPNNYNFNRHSDLKPDFTQLKTEQYMPVKSEQYSFDHDRIWMQHDSELSDTVHWEANLVPSADVSYSSGLRHPHPTKQAILQMHDHTTDFVPAYQRSAVKIEDDWEQNSEASSDSQFSNTDVMSPCNSNESTTITPVLTNRILQAADSTSLQSSLIHVSLKRQTPASYTTEGLVSSICDQYLPHSSSTSFDTYPSTTTKCDGPDPNEIVLGIYTRAQRAAKIARYRAKRQQRIWGKHVMYGCRKRFADKRPRVGGRFVKLS